MRETRAQRPVVALVALALLAAAIWGMSELTGDGGGGSAVAATGLRQPANVSAELLADGRSAHIRWTPVQGATNYRVGWVDIAEIANADTSSGTWLDPLLYHDLRGSNRSEYVVEDLPAGSRYYFFVGAYHQSGRHSEVYWSSNSVAWVDTPAASAPVPEPDRGTGVGGAYIRSVEIAVDPSPNGLDALIVHYTLPSYCYTVRDARYEQLGDQFAVDILVDVFDGACAQAIREETRRVWTNRVDLIVGRTYTVEINGGAQRLQVVASSGG